MRQKLTLCKIKKEYLQFVRNAKAIPSEFQHALVIADIDVKKIRKVVRKTCTERIKITLLKCEDQETFQRKCSQIS